MPAIDVVDSTWFAARATSVAAIVADARNWPRWWPDLDLEVTALRGEKGVQWVVRSASGRARGLAGTAEVWLEPMHDGVVAHFFLRLDPVNGTAISRGRAEHLTKSFRARTKQVFWALADELDPDRLRRLTGVGAPTAR